MNAQLTIGMLVFPEVQLLDVIGPLDVFRSARGVTPLLIGMSQDPLDLGNGIVMTPEATLDDARPLDVLFVPGGAGIRHVLANGPAMDALATRGAEARYVTSVCTGSLVLGAAGLLHGYRATSHWRFRELLERCGAVDTPGRVVRDRNRITGGGVTAGIDFALTLVAELISDDEAQSVQLRLEYNPQPPFNAGSPDDAPAEIVAKVRQATQKALEDREMLIDGALRRRSH